MRAVASGFTPREKGLVSANVAHSPNISSGSLIRSLHCLRLLLISQPGEQSQASQDCVGRLTSSVAYSGRAIHSLAGPHAVAAQASAFATAEYAVLDVGEFAESARDTNAAGGAKNVFSHSGKRESEGELDISKIGISRGIVDALAKRNISHLFPIQRAVFEPAMQGRDLIARAKTGTGKTLAFGIPILNYIIRENEKTSSMRFRGKAPLALVLAPTRELAKQVEREFHDSAPKLETICVYGGVSILAQQHQLQKGVDIAVGTPGRIIDLLERGSLNLRDVKYVVLDEADQMLAIGFAEDVEKILNQLPAQRQSMLFSATMPDWVKNLSRKFLQKPAIIDLVGENEEKLAEGIKLYSVSIASSAKRSILNDLITVYAKGGKTIVFTQTKRDADDVATAMSKILGCAALHGDITQNQREKTLEGFRNGRFTVLVATDVAARGLDIPNVDLVIHYEIPNCPEGFVHRSGRTGRAGKEGTTILMHTQIQRRTVQMIERDVGCKFVQISPPSADDVLKSSSDYAARTLQKVHPDVRDAFLPTAQKLCEQQGPAALAAALAYLSGFTQPIASRSLLTHEQGWITLRIMGSGQGPSFSSSRTVMGVLSRLYSPAADHVGKICMLDDSNVDGAVFDLPEDVAKALLSIKSTTGERIDAPKQLPKIIEDSMPSDNYGRPFLKRSGVRGFGERNPGFGGFGQRGSGYGRPEAFGGRERKWEPSNNSFNRTTPGSGGRDRPFSGNCFACGLPGHYTLDCPTRQEKRY